LSVSTDIEILADQALGWARLLDLGDEPELVAVHPVAQGAGEAARGILRANLALQRGAGHPHFGVRDLAAFIGFDAGEDVGHFNRSSVE
jgi:hypothetical protein